MYHGQVTRSSGSGGRFIKAVPIRVIIVQYTTTEWRKRKQSSHATSFPPKIIVYNEATKRTLKKWIQIRLKNSY